jgi:hypothetical protein
LTSSRWWGGVIHNLNFKIPLPTGPRKNARGQFDFFDVASKIIDYAAHALLDKITL